jgi:hypothetical protein
MKIARRGVDFLQERNAIPGTAYAGEETDPLACDS